MEKNIKIRMILFILFSIIHGIIPEEIYSQPDPPETWPPYSSKAYTTIKTPKGENLEAIQFTDRAEWVDYWEEYGEWLIEVEEWDAVWQGPATHLYNCHGYAWYKSEEGVNVWIDYYDRYYNPNLSKYWTGLNSYKITGSTEIGRKVRYTDDNHSAITTSSFSYVISKWGRLPLYRHLKSHCPYICTNLQYYELNPNMTGSTNPLCYNVQRTFSTDITYMVQATLTWIKGPYIIYVSGGGTPQFTVKGSGNGNSYVNLQIITPSAFSWASGKNFWAGKPLKPFNINCVPYPNCNPCPDEYIDMFASDHNNLSITSYNWIVAGGTIIDGQGTKEITVLAGSNPGTHFDKWVRAENTCGVSDYYGEYGYIEDCGGSEFMAIPNPADNYLDIDINEEKMTAEDISISKEYFLTMVDKMGTVKYTAEVREFPYRINTIGIPAGLYVINLIYDGKISSIKVLIEH